MHPRLPRSALAALGVSEDKPEDRFRVAQGRSGRRQGRSYARQRPEQEFILRARQGEARRAIQRVQEIDPNWRPRDSAIPTDSLEGQISRAEGRRDEALARWRELTTREPNSVIDAFRRGHGLETVDDPTWLVRKNTVAHCTFDDQTFLGVNSREISNYTPRDDRRARKMRSRLLDRFPDEMSTDSIGRRPNDALFHAEATCLIRAADANRGTLVGKTVEVTVDRQMCPSCKDVLPLVGLELGNPTVTFREFDGTVIRTMRDGRWLR